MSSTKYIFDRVKKTANKAIQAERNGNLTAAFELFLQAAELLNQLIAIEKTKKIRDSYYQKAKEYIKRAKEIRMLVSGPPDDIDLVKDLPSTPKTGSRSAPPKDKPPLPPPPTDKKHTPLPPPPKDKTPPPPPPKEKTLPPPTSDDTTAKMMRGEDDSQDKPKKAADIPPPPPKPSEPKTPPPEEKIDLPSKTTYELLLDEGNYRDCIKECAHSVEAELRVRMGMFDEQLTLGMLIEKGSAKGIEALKDFKFVNIILNRIEHENYRPSLKDAENAVFITTKILMS
ncbi:MAG: hypothetical protein ACTSQ0_02535 [Candidatus Heimdallarchaeota archaeon]